MRRICKRISKVFGGGEIDYEIVRIDSDYGIYSVKVGESIGVNYHYGIKIPFSTLEMHNKVGIP